MRQKFITFSFVDREILFGKEYDTGLGGKGLWKKYVDTLCVRSNIFWIFIRWCPHSWQFEQGI